VRFRELPLTPERIYARIYDRVHQQVGSANPDPTPALPA
jgi:hypothetical protein